MDIETLARDLDGLLTYHYALEKTPTITTVLAGLRRAHPGRYDELGCKEMVALLEQMDAEGVRHSGGNSWSFMTKNTKGLSKSAHTYRIFHHYMGPDLVKSAKASPLIDATGSDADSISFATLREALELVHGEGMSRAWWPTDSQITQTLNALGYPVRKGRLHRMKRRKKPLFLQTKADIEAAPAVEKAPVSVSQRLAALQADVEQLKKDQASIIELLTLLVEGNKQ